MPPKWMQKAGGALGAVVGVAPPRIRSRNSGELLFAHSLTSIDAA
jgi:hypothetical protein